MSPKMLLLLPLLLLFCTKQTSSAKVKYGLGGYTMDKKQQMMVPKHALLLKSAEDVKKYKTNDHIDTQFKPCTVKLRKDKKFEVFYDENTAKRGCTVDFVMSKIVNIKTWIKVEDKKMGCLEDCRENLSTSIDKNLVPFTYSMSNEQFKKLHKGPPYKEGQKCKTDCVTKGGKCMNSATSLQLAWDKCTMITNVHVRASIQLVGEPVYWWHAEIKDKKKKYPDVAFFQLSIEMGDNPKFTDNRVPLFTVTGPEGKAQFLYKKDSEGKNYLYPACFLNDTLPMIPVPQFWPIKSGNPQLNGKRLLVFHFLPQSATRIFNGKGKLLNHQPPGRGMPKCKGKLSISFENVVGLLQSSTGLPPTEPTTTTKATTTAKPPPMTTTSSATDGSEPPSAAETTEASGKPKRTKKQEGTRIRTIIGIVVGTVVLLLIIFAALVWYFCCRDPNKEGEEEAETDSGEGKEKIILDPHVTCVTSTETRFDEK